uniref:Uncharacterized protein n=1 Tax=Haptolina ericina TaxID=156174 RepID=A0A7S3FAH4_9EUKA
MELYPSLKESAIDLYNVEKRPEKVAAILLQCGAEKVLSKVGISEPKSQEWLVQEISQLTTISGLREKKVELSELAAPYIEKAACAEGRKELLAETKAYALPYAGKVLEPIETKLAVGKELAEAKLAAGKEIAAPYISSVKESSAPYVAKLDAIRRSERVEAMVAAFQDARAHPVDKVSELKSKAVDLIKYENIKSYRDHVMSTEFRADTARLVKVELPAVAAAAAKRGAETVKAKAIALTEELECIKAKTKVIVAQGYEMANEVELESLRAKFALTSAALVAELQQGVAHIKEEGFSLADVIERLKRVATCVEAAFTAPPAITEEEPAEEVEEPASPIETGADTKTPDDSVSVSGSEEEAMHDAHEEEQEDMLPLPPSAPTLTPVEAEGAATITSAQEGAVA